MQNRGSSESRSLQSALLGVRDCRLYLEVVGLLYYTPARKSEFVECEHIPALSDF